MAFLLYAGTAMLLLWLAHRCVRAIPLAAALLLLVLPLGLVGRALITDGVYGPIDFLYQDAPFSALRPDLAAAAPRNASATDVYSEFYPWRHAVRESLRRGEWPLWNAFNLCGHPLAAEAQSAPYSPFTLLACLLPSAVSLTYTVAMALFIAGLCAFLFARELECSEAASLIAAIGWGLAGCVVLYSHTAMGFSTVYLPLILAFARRIVLHPGLASMMRLAIALALCLLAGHPESLFLNVLVGFASAIFALIRRRIRPWRPIAFAIGAAIVAASLCAGFLLPLLEAFPQSAEVAIKSGQSLRSQGVSGARALAALARDFFPYLNVRAWTSPNLGHIGAETAAVGSIALALAIYAIWRRRSAEVWFFAGTALFCIGAGVRWKPISDALQHVPLLHITHHDRLAFAGAFCLAVLAALGFDALLQRRDFRAAAIVTASVLAVLAIGTWMLTQSVTLAPVAGGFGKYKIFAELVFLALAVPLFAFANTRWMSTALIALMLTQRVLSGGDAFSTYPARDAYPPLQILESLRDPREPFRIVGRATAFPPATNTFYGLEDVRGYEALTLFQFVETWNLWNRPHGSWYHRVDDLTAPFLSFMNVRYAIQASTLDVPPGWRTVTRNQGTSLIENERVLDRIFVPARVVLGNASSNEIVDRMARLDDFRTYAWITTAGDSIERDNGPGTIQLRSRSVGGEYVFDADMQGDGWVVISDSAWKGWRAYVDGRRQRLSRANGAFLSVHVPQGKHTVRVVYLPVSFVRGRVITFATIALWIAVALLLRFKATRRRAA
jgi:hypothetical protein